jgi:uncharacterized protein with HEPN domain
MSSDQITACISHVRFIIDSIDLALSYVEGLSKEDFLTDKRTQQAVILNILHIGEAANKIVTDFPEFTQSRKQIPWEQMRGMRNRLAHGYFDIDLEVVWVTLLTSFPVLRSQIHIALP